MFKLQTYVGLIGPTQCLLTNHIVAFARFTLNERNMKYCIP